MSSTSDDAMAMPCCVRAQCGDDAVAILRKHGVVHVPDLLSATELEACREAANGRFANILRSMLLKQVLRMQNGEPPLPTKFFEVVERDGGRFDCRFGLDELRTLLDDPSKLTAALGAVLGPEVAIVSHGQVVALSVHGRDAYACSTTRVRCVGVICASRREQV